LPSYAEYVKLNTPILAGYVISKSSKELKTACYSVLADDVRMSETCCGRRRTRRM
jgi:hypothetical protein